MRHGKISGPQLWEIAGDLVKITDLVYALGNKAPIEDDTSDDIVQRINTLIRELQKLDQLLNEESCRLNNILQHGEVEP